MIHNKILELRKKALPFMEYAVREGQKVEITDNVVNGYAIVWGVKDTYGTKFIKGCCAKSINDRGPESPSSQKILMVWQHDEKDPVGRFSLLREDDYGLRFSAIIDNISEVPNGMRTVSQIRSGTINQFSIGFNYIWDKMEVDETDDSVVCKEIDLFHIAPVTRASIAETHAIRSVGDDRLALNEDIEYFIKSIPRKQQLELRQLLTRQISLLKVEPPAQALKSKEPIDYEYLLNNFKL